MKTALITGATGGIGIHVARGLATRGDRVVITGRDQARGEAAAAELRREAGHAEVHFIQVDHSLMAANRELEAEISRRFDRLDILINNVGGIFPERRMTTEGHELSLAMNFLGPASLTLAILPLLRRSAPARVVQVSSTAWHMAKGDPLEDLQATQRFVGIEVHARAKLLSLLFTMAIARKESEVSVNAVNPGSAWTPMVESITPQTVPAWRFIWPLVRWFQRRASPSDAARGPLLLATEAAAAGTGRFFDELKEKPIPKHLQQKELQDRVLALATSLTS